MSEINDLIGELEDLKRDKNYNLEKTIREKEHMDKLQKQRIEYNKKLKIQKKQETQKRRDILFYNLMNEFFPNFVNSVKKDLEEQESYGLGHVNPILYKLTKEFFPDIIKEYKIKNE